MLIGERSDSVAGVINFSLLRKFKGLNLDFSYQETDNYDQSESSLGMLIGERSDSIDLR